MNLIEESKRQCHAETTTTAASNRLQPEFGCECFVLRDFVKILSQEHLSMIENRNKTQDFSKAVCLTLFR